ncbi:MAG: TAXI family TRAP transporter solute-binding subunit [Planctomycetota bacterium]|nr:TAXI family TRAP transporter solute-binding subunit [Planctomycetota bacterium]
MTSLGQQFRTILRRTLQLWKGWIGPVVVIMSLLLWWNLQPSMPGIIRVATANQRGQYHGFATLWSPHLREQCDREVLLLPTLGSKENAQLLRDHEVDLAILQIGSVNMSDFVIIAPLFPDVVHIVVRKESNIDSIDDLKGKAVTLGAIGSGMRESAITLLKHYNIEVESLTQTDAYFFALDDDPTLDAAIVTTGFVNSDLRTLLRDHRFKLLPIEETDAINRHQHYFTSMIIPTGLYSLETPPVPVQPIQTVATTAVLAARKNVSRSLVKAVAASLYQDFIQTTRVSGEPLAPSVMTAQQAREWSDFQLHDVTHSYLFPYQGIGAMARVVEGLAAMKEVIFALGAGIYFLWLWRKRQRRRLERRAVESQLRRLESLLDETIRIEESQIGDVDKSLLLASLDEVTRVKLKALNELTHEELRGDQMFFIFLQQCSNLTRKIQLKISMHSSNGMNPLSAPPNAPDIADAPTTTTRKTSKKAKKKKATRTSTKKKVLKKRSSRKG